MISTLALETNTFKIEKIEDIASLDGNEGTIRGVMFGIVVVLIAHGT